MLQVAQRTQDELKQEQDRLRATLEQKIEEQRRLIVAMVGKTTEQADQAKTIMQRVEKIETQLNKIETKLDTIPSGTPSYAEIARTPPSSQPQLESFIFKFNN
ncbi:hypothetical protein T440DRAFT_315187 [Plenodomus tracheiphilus IPT5]|uniref:Uncharacterized protein n=1 Tax=Plenodomus tracheiphilus IPT5 TaxID=1408161 RepID=A0A6A7AR23_9PLEO|nr:hypothetical protein T440DRAFT_315187 [Plenodomus tracheiphilus IPT5]